MSSPSAIRTATFAAAGLVVPFVVLWLYLVLLLRAGVYLPHAELASYGGLGLSLLVGWALFWQLPLRGPWRIVAAVLYLVCLTPLLLFFAITTVCDVTKRLCP
jgi:hypothetical protein